MDWRMDWRCRIPSLPHTVERARLLLPRSFRRRESLLVGLRERLGEGTTAQGSMVPFNVGMDPRLPQQRVLLYRNGWLPTARSLVRMPR